MADKTKVLKLLALMEELEAGLEMVPENSQGFCQSVLTQYFENGCMSYRQLEAIQRIYSDFVAVGEQLPGTLEETYVMLKFASNHIEKPKMQFRVDDKGNDIALIFDTKRGTATLTNAYAASNWGSHYMYGRITFDGILRTRNGVDKRPEWDSVKAFVELLIKDPLQCAKMSAARVGRCTFCWKELTDPDSKSHGYGPICAQHFHLPWKGQSNKRVDVDSLLARLV